ncbi:MAG TPA: hypothetical protein ENI87_09840 [bacterium]|nr:hypothetical protein [bacterium]
MRFQLGIPMCLLAGCVLQPTGPVAPTPATTTATRPAPLAAARDGAPCIGLEFLPPDDRLPALAPVRVEVPGPTGARPPSEPSPPPRLAELDFAAVDDPFARETLRFCRDLIETDQQRVRREVGIPFFDLGWRGPDDGLLASERRRADDRHRWLQANGRRLLNRPMQLLGKRLPIVRDLQIAFEDIRAHLPLTRPYNESHQGSRELGRLSLRLHVREFSDPVEVVYINKAGVRIGTSRLRGKLSLDFDLGGSLGLSLRARTDYRTGDTGLRTDLAWRPSLAFSLHLAAGDDMDFLAATSTYSMFESPGGSGEGLVLYAVHTF